MKVHGDASVFVSALAPGDAVALALGEGRGAYLYVISGGLEANGERMATGDAARIRDEPDLKLAAAEDTELILVDVALR